jgi:anthranilate phosphoribosyltransferase
VSTVTPQTILARLISRTDLTVDEARGLFDQIMDGAVGPEELAAILAALATKGESVSELVGGAEAMRSRVTPIQLPPSVSAIDTCSTGGDGRPTFNLSTTVAIVAAAAGATVAKHGNRSNTRASGSAEGLMALGVNVDAPPPIVERCLAEARIGFLFAPMLHPAMRHAAPVRRKLGTRTIFNLLGPLTNPAGVRRQLLGVNRPELVETMIEVLRLLGAERACVVHGLEGLCDLSISGPSLLARWDGRRVRVEDVDCRATGSDPAPPEALYVRSPAESAAVIGRILAGEPGPPREAVVLNAAAALWVSGLADDWTSGAVLARQALDSGAARDTLSRWCELSHGTTTT